MSAPQITRFKKQFIIDGREVEVDFHPVNILVKQLYQIYIPVNGKPFRIHMQKEKNGRFEIAMNDDRIPQYIKDLQTSFEQAIIDA